MLAAIRQSGAAPPGSQVQPRDTRNINIAPVRDTYRHWRFCERVNDATSIVGKFIFCKLFVSGPKRA